jgi:hypothetical protein
VLGVQRFANAVAQLDTGWAVSHAGPWQRSLQESVQLDDDVHDSAPPQSLSNVQELRNEPKYFFWQAP